VETARTTAGGTLPVLGALCPALGTGASVVDRGEVLSAFVSFVERLAEDRLVWLVVEDLHWSDSSSRELLGYLVRVTGPCRLVVLITNRTSDPSTPAVSEFVSELIRVADVERVTLGPLSPARSLSRSALSPSRRRPPTWLNELLPCRRGIPSWWSS